MFPTPSATDGGWETAVLAEWKNESGRAFFSWRWARMSEQERRAWFYDAPDGFHALEHLVRLVLQSADEIWEENPKISWARYLGNSDGLLLNEAGKSVAREKEEPRLHFWRTFFDELFCRSQWEIIEHQPNVREWLLEQSSYGYMRIEVSRPTAHERLEARLELRGWLEQNVSSQRRRWLLPP